MNQTGNTIEQFEWDELTLAQQTRAFEAFCREPKLRCDHAIDLIEDCEFCEIEYRELSQACSATAGAAV